MSDPVHAALDLLATPDVASNVAPIPAPVTDALVGVLREDAEERESWKSPEVKHLAEALLDWLG